MSAAEINHTPQSSGKTSQAKRLAVAPMMEWTDRHCRSFHRTLTKEAVLYTEMVTTGALIHGDVPRKISTPLYCNWAAQSHLI